MRITEELLNRLEFDHYHHNRFALVFPLGVELTRDLIVQHADELDWTWYADNLASADGWAAYNQAERSAFAGCQSAIRSAEVIRKQAIQQVKAEYDQAVMSARYAVNRVVTPADHAHYRDIFLQTVESAKAAYRWAINQVDNTAYQDTRLLIAVYNVACATAFVDAIGL